MNGDRSNEPEDIDAKVERVMRDVEEYARSLEEECRRRGIPDSALPKIPDAPEGVLDDSTLTGHPPPDRAFRIDDGKEEYFD